MPLFVHFIIAALVVLFVIGFMPNMRGTFAGQFTALTLTVLLLWPLVALTALMEATVAVGAYLALPLLALAERMAWAHVPNPETHTDFSEAEPEAV